MPPARPILRLLIAVLGIALFSPSFAHAAGGGGEAPPIPDFTKGGKAGDADDWTLGPTGARGWIYSANGHSRQARQILVTAVAKGSPADRALLRVGDVILGVDGQAFADDARSLLAKAIATAESEKGAGTLRLLRWREGKMEKVELRLAVLGTYSATAPYDCPKSKRILDLGCASLAHRMAAPDYARTINPIPRSLNALALLASGNKEYLPLVRQEAKWASDFTSNGFISWYYGYIMAFLGEYVMATGDQSVVPGMQRLALATARGQSKVGTWGHLFVQPNGNLEGYGCMNQPGLSLTIGMELAREAGVKDPDLDRAIAKAAGFLRWYVDKGAVPYGDHQPFPAHEDNGKCASAAVLFDLLGDREAAEYFSKMATAAYSERERGHTGDYFNYLWALPGVARCGPLAIGAYLKEQSWYYDLARAWDTSFTYQHSPVGEEEHHKYTGWDCSGSYLLAYALPLKSLRLTGRKPFAVPPLNAAQVAEVIAAGRDYTYKGEENRYEKRTPDQLLAGLASWSPFVRKRSAAALGKQEGNFLPVLLKMLASTNRDARYGACEALGALGPRANAAAPQLRATLRDADPWVQSLGAQAILNLGPAERKGSVSDLLALAMSTNPADPRHHAELYASTVLFYHFPGARAPKSILEDSLDGVNRAQLYPAIQALLKHEDSIARGSTSKAFAHLTDADIVALLPDIVTAIEHLAPSNEMFSDSVRLAGLDLLSRLHIREGMTLCVSTLEPERWGEKNRAKDCLAYLQRYGISAKPLVPSFQEARAYLANVKKSPAENLKEFDQTIAAIEASTAAPTLVSLADFRNRPQK